MTPAQYLDACKEVLSLSSDYALAQRLDFPKQYVSYWRSGQKAPDAFACTKIAITLNLDPATVIADIQAQAEKNPKRAEFWRSFLARARAAAAVLITLAACYSASFGSVPAGHGGGFRRRYKLA